MQAVNLLNASDPAPIREISDADAPHRINISSVWALPFGKGRHFLNSSNGWFRAWWADGKSPASGACRAASRWPGAT